MKHAKTLITATLILICASVSYADCGVKTRVGDGMFSNTVAASSVKAAVKAPVASSTGVKATRY
jgi:hypothetical protein